MANILTMIRELARNGLGAPVLVVIMLAMVVLPLPPVALDLLFTFNISLGLIVLLVVVYVARPLEFAVFPTVLLVATLLRLALNVASTRVVLLNGHEGGDAAGKVIQAFGEFVVGGNYTVGLVVFVILVIINFVVVTKGAGRVSEVSARFTLDAMPGKQMAIDADLNAGLITQEEAIRRRSEVSQESDFYGSMDGASKFVRGDAIAGILILVINIVGGLAVGMVQHDLDFSTAMRYYTLLTVGDGLVAQIPSLVLSTAAAIIVTRVSRAQDMGEQILGQMFSNPRVLFITATVIGSLGLIPGMPNFAFLSLAGLMGLAGWWGARKAAEPEVLPPEQKALEAQKQEQASRSHEPAELSWEDVQPVDMIGLEVGYRLIPLVDTAQGGQLMPRIKGVRRKLSQELGFLVHPVHIRDNLDMAPNVYRITLKGVRVGEAEVHPDRELAINPGQVFGTLQGLQTKDPAFGMDAVWIDGSQREHAQSLGYTVVDPSTVVATHLSQILQSHAAELLGHEEAQQLLNNLAKGAGKLVEGLVPEVMPLSRVVRVLQNLLAENVPIRDMRTIIETLVEYGTKTQDPDVLTAFVRTALGRAIVQRVVGGEDELPVITLDPELEHMLQETLQTMSDGSAGLEPGLAKRLQDGLQQSYRRQEAAGKPAVLLVAQPIRMWLSQFMKRFLPDLSVLAYNEIPDDRKIRIVSTIGG